MQNRAGRRARKAGMTHHKSAGGGRAVVWGVGGPTAECMCMCLTCHLVFLFVVFFSQPIFSRNGDLMSNDARALRGKSRPASAWGRPLNSNQSPGQGRKPHGNKNRGDAGSRSAPWRRSREGGKSGEKGCKRSKPWELCVSLCRKTADAACKRSLAGSRRRDPAFR